jgi:hypothetical protein
MCTPTELFSGRGGGYIIFYWIFINTCSKNSFCNYLSVVLLPKYFHFLFIHGVSWPYLPTCKSPRSKWTVDKTHLLTFLPLSVYNFLWDKCDILLLYLKLIVKLVSINGLSSYINCWLMLEPIGWMTKTLNLTMYAERDHLKIESHILCL